MRRGETGMDTSDTEDAAGHPAGTPCRGSAPEGLAHPVQGGRPAAFIDRDGTLIEEAHYLSDPSRLRLVPGAADALRALNEAGYACVVVTNQSAIGRGMISESRLAEIHRELRRQLAAAGAAVDAIYFCPDAPPPDGDPDADLAPLSYRKPGPGMFLRAAGELGLDLAASWSVGDMLRDLQAAHRAGCAGNLLVLSGKGRTQTEVAASSGVPHEVVDDLASAAARIVSGRGPRTQARTLGVLVNIYPMGSLTFIRRELAALEAAGQTVRRYAVQPWGLPLVDPEDQAEEARTRRLLDRGVLPALAATALTALTRPGRFARAVATAWRFGRFGAPDRGRLRHLIYLAEACLLRRWLARDGVAHLHAHFAHQPAATALFCRLLGGPPYSFTLHGVEEFERAVGATLGAKVRHAAFVVAVSSFARGQIWRWSRVDDWDKVQVVHCGLERSAFPAVPAPPPDARRVVCVGRLSEEKGHLVLIEAAARLRDRDPDRTFEIVLVGDGPLRGVLEQRVGRLGLAGHVRFAGWLSNDQVRAELTAARGLVLSSFVEGLPVVIMEALAMGRPVVASQITGIPELVRPGENGWLVPTGDIEALASAIGALLDAPTDQLARMGQAGAERVGRDHDIRTEAGKLLDLIHRAGAGRG